MKRILAIVAVVSLLVGLVFGTSIAAGEELHVGPEGDYASISDAVEAANNGDTIIVHEDATYEESVEVSKPVTIQAAEDEGPVVDGGYEPAFVFTANGATLQGIGIRSSQDSEDAAGIIVYSAQCLIQENEIIGDGNIIGIWLDNGAHDNQIIDNSIENVSAGIILEPGCHHNDIEANGIFDITADGISMSDSHDNNVIENTIEAEGEYGIMATDGSSNNTIKENRVMGSWIQGISLYRECHDNLIMDNVINDSFEESAINIECSSDNEIIGNLITGSCGWNGITVSGCCEDEENCEEEESGDEPEMLLAVDNLIEGNVVDVEAESAIWINETALGTTISGNFISGYYSGGDPEGAAINIQDNTVVSCNVVSAECSRGIAVKNFNQVLQNDVSGCQRGIVVGGDEGNLISGNFVHDNSEGGLWLELSFDNTIENNIAVSNGTGIELHGASNNEILNNTVYNSECNGIAAENTDGANAEDNLIQGNLTFFNGDGESCFDLYDDDDPIDNIWEPNVWDTANFED